ncbi:Protein of unknown function (DUF423) [gamma proteobacterium HdN1]|nr:Protein of unknown function (DUF423) [gamma proteobacterium HdN1]
MKLWFVAGAICMALAVALGAFGAHGLKNRLPADLLAIYHTGVEYHIYHALGLLLVGVIAGVYPTASGVQWAGGLLLAGILVFSGSLYALSLSGIRVLGAITPLGGLAFIAGWITLAVSVWRAS